MDACHGCNVSESKKVLSEWDEKNLITEIEVLENVN
jgi:hypothetical protein